jgi:hypothetical protein
MVSQNNISRRGFLAKAGAIFTGLLFLSAKPIWAIRGGRPQCPSCQARIKPEASDEVIVCPNCGREWWTGEFILDGNFSHRFPGRESQSDPNCWDYAQVPFPNFQMLEKSEKPVLSFKQLTFSGRRTA